jgi:hypothetical protein
LTPMLRAVRVGLREVAPAGATDRASVRYRMGGRRVDLPETVAWPAVAQPRLTDAGLLRW